MAHPIATRYAKAYFALAKGDSAVQAWREDLAKAVETLTSPDVQRALHHPEVRRRGTAELEALLSGVGKPARNLVRLLVDHGRNDLFGEVLNEYDRLVAQDSGVVRAEVTTAVHVDEQLEINISEALRRSLGGDVEVNVHQDPSIGGGLIIRIGDRVIDNSVRKHLQQLQAAVAG